MTPTTQAASILSRRDLRFLLHEWMGIGGLGARPRYRGQSADLYDDVLELAERLATDLFAPHNRGADVNEPRLEDGKVRLEPAVAEALAAFSEASLMGVSVDEEFGGMQLPLVLATAASAWFHAANTSTTAYAMLTTAAANTLIGAGSSSLVERWVPPLVSGRFFGTMCLTEPQAGSSLADITTRAERADDGTYRLFGGKMWISGAEHEMAENIVHMVLARIDGAPAGVKGISLFVVPRFLLEEDGTVGAVNDVALAGLNHKMGFRGTVNGVLSFGDGVHRPHGAPGAVGYLVGEPDHGLAYMFRMMNEARIGVGIGAVAVGYTGFLKSLQYARERPQGRTRSKRDPLSPQVPIIDHPDVRRMLLAQKAYVEGGLALVLYCGRLHDDVVSLEDPTESRRAELLLELLTPIAKSWPAQWCLAANDLAIQVHGGYGYSREYDVEQHYRDNRLNQIHEGTHGIQAIDLLGRKVGAADGEGFRRLVDIMRETVVRARDVGGEAGELGEKLSLSIGRLEAVTAGALEAADPGEALANATAYLEATGHVVVAWLWLEQFLVAAAGDETDPFYEGKRQAARFFVRCELPKTDVMFDLVERRDRTAMDMLDDWF
jgi:butyryl-CoA dehydrogenase